MAKRTTISNSMDGRDLLYVAVVRQALADLREPDEAEASQWFLDGTLVLKLHEERRQSAEGSNKWQLKN